MARLYTVRWGGSEEGNQLLLPLLLPEAATISLSFLR